MSRLLPIVPHEVIAQARARLSRAGFDARPVYVVRSNRDYGQVEFLTSDGMIWPVVLASGGKGRGGGAGGGRLHSRRIVLGRGVGPVDEPSCRRHATPPGSRRRCLGVSDAVAVASDVDAAFSLFLASPAPSANVLARPDPVGARHAADGEETVGLQRVTR